MMSENERSGPIPERDQVFIQTFGLGIDEAKNAAVCVYLRYLSLLSPEHQRFWEPFTSHSPAKMHENYYKPTILGEWWENNSAISAIRFSIMSINLICEHIWGTALFAKSVPDEVHYNLSPFMRPSSADYLSFADARSQTINVLRKVRKERQPAAHAFIQNEHDQQYIGRKRELLLDSAFALGNIFFMLQRHPEAPVQRVPKFFEEGRIEAW